MAISSASGGARAQTERPPDCVAQHGPAVRLSGRTAPPIRDMVHRRAFACTSLSVSVATLSDVPIIASLRTAVAEELTRHHGRGHWSSCATEKGVLRALKTSRLLVVRRGAEVVGTVRLDARKPWAIDVAYFAMVPKAVYLHDLAVATHARGRGVGRLLVEKARAVAQAWPSNAIRLDAYDHPAGAAPFYVKCGFRQVGRVTYRGVPLVYLERLL